MHGTSVGKVGLHIHSSSFPFFLPSLLSFHPFFPSIPSFHPSFLPFLPSFLPKASRDHSTCHLPQLSTQLLLKPFVLFHGSIIHEPAAIFSPTLALSSSPLRPAPPALVPDSRHIRAIRPLREDSRRLRGLHSEAPSTDRGRRRRRGSGPSPLGEESAGEGE